MHLDHRMFERHQYALINPLQIDRRIIRLWPCEPIVPKELRGQRNLFPYLLQLDEMAADARLVALDDTVNYAREHERSPFSALLVCQAGSDHLRRHLARMMVRKIEGEQMLFRYYDPRVWNALRWILSPSQLDALLGPIQSWTAPMGCNDSWDACDNKGSRNVQLRFASDQIHPISALASVNKVIDRLHQERCGADSFSLSKQVFNEIIKAAELGLIDADDQEAFAFVSMIHSPAIHAGPLYQEALRIAIEEPGAYRSMVAGALDDEEVESSLQKQHQGVWQHG
ncbi:MAG: hypothetical protein GAK31_00016 [Stenotrophomonas maltophilia]|uniref:DUF4123 domain-containing protein n=1 Tax=Stenotrophomonas maltophilia TaxID=40324 RepID=A0A7V8FIH9_STEMA|nr:MAG: hypothetical protein GAK31_00016 [Stenotrophomonas maltophilia]